MKTYLEPEEIDKLEESATNFRDKLLIRTLFRLAGRISAIIAIAVNDIDFKKETITIKLLKERTSLSCPNCKTRLSKSHKYCPGCSRKINQATKEIMEQTRRRILPIDPGTLEMLKEFIDRGGPVNRNGKLLIFPFNRHRAWQIVTECARRADLPNLVNPESGKEHHTSPHRLRDAFAVNAVKKDDSGDGLRMLQEHLGHQAISTTMRYRKVAGEEHKEWYDKLWNEEDAD